MRLIRHQDRPRLPSVGRRSDDRLAAVLAERGKVRVRIVAGVAVSVRVPISPAPSLSAGGTDRPVIEQLSAVEAAADERVEAPGHLRLENHPRGMCDRGFAVAIGHGERAWLVHQSRVNHCNGSMRRI